jgi:hypothetical protein
MSTANNSGNTSSSIGNKTQQNKQQFQQKLKSSDTYVDDEFMNNEDNENDDEGSEEDYDINYDDDNDDYEYNQGINEDHNQDNNNDEINLKDNDECNKSKNSSDMFSQSCPSKTQISNPMSKTSQPQLSTSLSSQRSILPSQNRHSKRNFNIDEEFKYEVLTPDKIVQHMIECIKEVNQVIQLPPTTTRILLHHFRWDKEKLMERFYDGDQESLFKEAHIVSPFKAYNRKVSVLFMK